MKKLTAVILSLVLCFSLVACGGDGITGSWLGEGQAQVLDEQNAVGDILYTFNEDGTCQMSYVFEDMPELGYTDEYQYTVSGNKITLTFDGRTIDMTYLLDGDTMEITARGTTGEYKRVD